MASTRRQVRFVCELVGVELGLVTVLAGPAVAHFCGHIIAAPGRAARFPADDEEEVAARIAEVVARRPVGSAFGALAAGADVLWAEAFLAAGCDLHVVLPVNRAAFVAASVVSAGPAWIARFERCIAAASVESATQDAGAADDVLFRYGTELAMGLAVVQARYLDADAVQFAVWDGAAVTAEVGTAVDVATWRSGGRSSEVITPPSALGREPGGAPSLRSARVVKAMLFADVKGFSALQDEALPAFDEHVLGAFASVLDALRRLHGPARCGERRAFLGSVRELTSRRMFASQMSACG